MPEDKEGLIEEEAADISKSAFHGPNLPPEIAKEREAENNHPEHDLPDGYSLISGEILNKVVAALDVDGTLIPSYLMERFLNYLNENPYFRYSPENISRLTQEHREQFDVDNLDLANLDSTTEKNIRQMALASSPEGKKTSKDKQLGQLLGDFEKVRKVKEKNPTADAYLQFRGYDGFIEKTGGGFAELLRGLPETIINKFAEEFMEREIREGRIFNHAKPLIEMLHKGGIIVSLVTGAPRILIDPLRKHFGIKEIGHALEFHKDAGGHFTGETQYNSGTPATKRKIMSLMRDKCGHYIIMAGGDSIPADGNLIAAAVNAKHDKDPYGCAIFFGETDTAINRAEESFGDELAYGRLLLVMRTRYSAEKIVEDVRDQLIKVCSDSRNVSRIPTLIRKKVSGLIEVTKKAVKKVVDPNQMNLFEWATAKFSGQNPPSGTEEGEKTSEPKTEGSDNSEIT